MNNLRVMQFDVIHNHSAHTLEDGLQLSQALQIPLVATCHYLDFEPLDILGQAHAVVAISDEMAAQLPFPREQIRIVENGVPVPRFVNLTNRPKAAVVLARVNEARQRAYAQTVDILREKGWEVMVAGGWRYPGARSLGWTQNPQLVLERARLVVCTGRAVREGMAAGCAVVLVTLDGLVTPENAAVLRRTNPAGGPQHGTYAKQPPPRAAKPESRKQASLFSRLPKSTSIKDTTETGLSIEQRGKENWGSVTSEKAEGEDLMKLVITVVEDTDALALIERQKRCYGVYQPAVFCFKATLHSSSAWMIPC